MSDPSLGLAPQDVSAILAFLQRYIPDVEVWAFGSRVRGTARPFSDLDLVVVNDKPLQAQTRAELTYALSESNLPIKVDLVEWAGTSESFRDIILQEHLVLKPKPS
jgi:uncharacterized protein